MPEGSRARMVAMSRSGIDRRVAKGGVTRIERCVAICAAVLPFSGCGGGEGARVYLGPDITYADTGPIIAGLRAEVDAAFGSEVMRFSDRPGGTATYSGVYEGAYQDGGVILDYAADLMLQVDFASGGVTGEARNFHTSLLGFDRPYGGVTIGGQIENDLGLDIAVANLGGGGELTQNERRAGVSIQAAEIYFSETGNAVRGTHRTDLIWVQGPDVGARSETVGSVIGVRD